jgi:transcription antitermination factor NusG
VLWTHSNCEGLVHDQLASWGFHPFLPRIGVWSVRARRRRLVSRPLFSGYLFLNDALDKAAHVAVRRARGLVQVLGASWDRPAEVPAAEVEGIRRVVESGAPAFAHPYLREGQRVRVVAGPLAGVDGILVATCAARGKVVLSVHLLQRSVSVEVDCADVSTSA